MTSGVLELGIEATPGTRGGRGVCQVGEGEAGGWAGEPAAEDAGDLVALDGVAAARETGAGHGRGRSLLYAEMTTSPAETCGDEALSSGRFSRIQFAAALFDSFAPASLA
jgi:hypothetical protein